MKFNRLAIAAMIGTLVLAGCETTSSRPYKASTDNILSFKSSLNSSGKTVSVGKFVAADGVDESLSCRALGALDVAPGKTPISFIEGALKEEIFEAGAYSVDGPAIRGRVDVLDADSWGTGSWKIDLNVSSDALPDGYNESVNFEFKSSYSAVKACQNVVDAFTPAVQELIGKIAANPNFAKLTK